MQRLDPQHFPAALTLYREWECFFPLIGAVLEQTQPGVVYTDYALQQVYVEHAFGFAQIFGIRVPAFEAALQHYLMVDKNFDAPKVRLYTPLAPDFLEGEAYLPLRSFRQRFNLDAKIFARAVGQQTLPSCLGRADEGGAVRAEEVNTMNVAAVDAAFDVVTRFWPSAATFIARAEAVVLLYHGKMASICYAAAVADTRAEIDVLTLPEYRKLGLGKCAATLFVQRCLGKGLEPLWDCFTNNTGSMQLCHAMGFVAARSPYTFFTIAK